MSVNVNFYSLIKRENSTKQPIGTPTVFPCTFIDDTSLMNPRLKLSIQFNPISFNYVYIADFNRYYFIREINTYQNFWYITLEEDTLASFKTELGSQSHYVLRSASSYDGDISDYAYPATTQVSGYKDGPDSTDPLWWYDGSCYIVGIVGYTDTVVNQFGSLIYYIMSPLALRVFLDYLMNNVATGPDPWSQILQTEYSDGVQKALINPIQYIKSCIRMPFNVDDITGSAVNKIQFGYYHYDIGTGYNVKRVDSSSNVVKTKDISYITLREHPQAATRGAYLNCQPFTRYTLHYGPWGDIELDPMLLKGNNKIKLETLYDLVSGVGRLIVSGNVNTAKVLYNSTVKIGVDVNLSQVYKDALGYEAATTNGIFSSVSAGISLGLGNLNALPQGLNMATAAVQDMTRLNYPTVSGIGDSGCYLPFYDTDNLYLLSRFNYIVDENLTEIGRPLCQTKVINTLSGYILCQNADCQISGTQAESQKINDYLNTGFFYE